jgi:hypothetical protein
MRGKPMVLFKDQNGCIVSTSHRLNKDDYLRIVDHKVKHNSTRYADRKAKAKEYWKLYKCTGTKLGEVFGVSFSSACKWIREWKCRD